MKPSVSQPASKGEEQLFETLSREFSNYYVASHFPIKVGRRTLYIDAYIVSLKIAFELDGRQHEEYVPHFHGDVSGFERGQENDRLKEQWCKDHNVKLIRFRHNEQPTVKRLRNKIKETLIDGETEARKS